MDQSENLNQQQKWNESIHKKKWKEKIYRIIFESNTFNGKLFDELLLVVILLSVLAVTLESVSEFRDQYASLFIYTEWAVTILFSIEYLLRIISNPRPVRYIFSFFGVVDLLSILPTYVSVFFPGIQPLIVIRALRLLRIYRILKLYRYIKEGNILIRALRNSFRKIFIFMGFVLVLVLLLGSLMYVIEGGENGFYSIPLSIYWAVITLTTVGYGDIVPVTALGKFIATFIMLLGYSIIAIPTGIVSSEMTRDQKHEDTFVKCNNCNENKNPLDASFCKCCGHKLSVSKSL